MSLQKYFIAEGIRQFKSKFTNYWKDNENFKNWFGNSKILNSKKEPLIVFHGTRNNFEEFGKGDIGYHFGTYKSARDRLRGQMSFNRKIVNLGKFPWKRINNRDDMQKLIDYYKNKYPNKNYILSVLNILWNELPIDKENYMNEKEFWIELIEGINPKFYKFHIIEEFDMEHEGHGDQIMPFFIKIENSLITYDALTWTGEDLWKAIRDGLEGTKLESEVNELYSNSYTMGGIASTSKANDQKYINLLRNNGYDGIRYWNEHEHEGSVSFIAFEPTQIKSIFNNGDFNPNDPNFMK